MTVLQKAWQGDADTQPQRSAAFLEAITSNSPTGLLVYHGVSGACELANQAMAEMCGTSVAVLLQQDWRSNAPWQPEGFAALAEAILADGCTRQSEVQLPIDNERSAYLHYFCSRFYLDGTPHLLVIGLDVTARREVEAELLQRTARYRSVMALSPDIISIIAADGSLAYNSPAARRIHGYSDEELAGRNTFELIHPDDQEAVAATVAQLLADPSQPRSVQYRYLNKDGSYVWMEATSSNRLTDPHLRGLVTISRDISERKRAEQLLASANERLEQQVQERTASLSRSNQQLSAEIEERARVERALREQQQQLEAMGVELGMAAERERVRIAGELHDEIGQRLVLSRIKIDALASQAGTDDQRQALEELRALTDETLRDIRSLTFQLRPPVLATAGLAAALGWLGEELQAQYGLAVDLRPPPHPLPLDYQTSSTLFQGVRELLLNVAKHAGCSRASVSMTTTGQTLVITVADAGEGCDPQATSAAGEMRDGFGLFNLRQRLAYLGGELTIDTAPGRGCRVTLMMPLPNLPAPAAA